MIATRCGVSPPTRPRPALASFSQLIMTLVAATVRHAITQDARAAGRILTLFKRMLPKNSAGAGREKRDLLLGNTAAQAELRLAFCRRRHAVIARTFGISPAQRR